MSGIRSPFAIVGREKDDEFMAETYENLSKDHPFTLKVFPGESHDLSAELEDFDEISSYMIKFFLQQLGSN